MKLDLAVAPHGVGVATRKNATRCGLILAVALLLGTGCEKAAANDAGAPAKAEPPAAKARRVEVAVVNPSQAGLKLSLPGEVQGERDALLASSLGGYVEAVEVADGDKVRKGQVLARVDTASHSARAAQAQVELENAKREWKRAQQLGDAIAGAELDAAEARYKAAKAAVWTAQVSVSRAMISAPFDGVVVDVNVEVGEVAAPGAPLVRLVQLDPAIVSVSLSDRDVVALRPGLEARVSPDARATVFTGTVKHIQPAADLRTRSFTAEIAVPNAEERLLPGMIVSVDLHAEQQADRMVISQDWLVTGLEQVGVFVENDGKAKWQPVKLGDVIRRDVVVEEGLQPGDRLVVTGHRELAEGDAVFVTREGACCTAGRIVWPSGPGAAPAPPVTDDKAEPKKEQE